jgi:transcriptional regulator with XRE-family HTH domain
MTATELKRWRKSAGLTRDQLATRIGVSARTIEAWEQEGRNRAIPTPALMRIKDLMNRDTLNVPLSPALREKLDKLRKERGIDPSSWAAEILDKILILAVMSLAAFHLSKSPSDWSLKALAKTGKALIALVM